MEEEGGLRPALCISGMRGHVRAEAARCYSGALPRTLAGKMPALPVEKTVEGGEEAGVGDGDAGGVADDAGARGAKSGDGKGHGDAVVAGRVDLGAVKRRSGGRDACGGAAGDVEAIRKFLDAGAHAAEVLGEGSDAVAFLDAQLLSVADFNSLLCVRAERCKHGQLVYHLRDLRA